MKKGYYFYYGVLTQDERDNFKEPYEFGVRYALSRYYSSIWHFISENCEYNEYWLKIANSDRSHRPKKKQNKKPAARLKRSLALCSIDIAVLTPYKKLFDLWVRNYGESGVNYIIVRKIDDIRGRRFDGYEFGYKSKEIKNTNELVYFIKARLK